MIDFLKHKKGDVVSVFCCDQCSFVAGNKPKAQPDSGITSLPCEVCGHYGIGSIVDCEVGDWLQLRPMRINHTGVRND